MSVDRRVVTRMRELRPEFNFTAWMTKKLREEITKEEKEQLKEAAVKDRVSSNKYGEKGVTPPAAHQGNSNVRPECTQSRGRCQ